MFCLLFGWFGDRVSLRSPGWPGVCFVEPVGLKLMESWLPLPPDAGIEGMHHPVYGVLLLWIQPAGTNRKYSEEMCLS